MLFFNNFIKGYEFLGFADFVELLEYVFPLIFYLLWCFVFIKYFLTLKIPDNKNCVLLAILTFLTGISTETLNLFFLTFLGILTFEFLLTSLIYRSPKIIRFLKFMLFLDSIFAFSLVCYYLHPADHSIFLSNNNTNFFSYYSKNFYFYVIKDYLFLPLISLFTSLGILITKNNCISLSNVDFTHSWKCFANKYFRTIDNLMIIFSITNILSLYLFFYFGNYLIMSVWSEDNRYFLFTGKFLFVFLIILTFNIILTTGYFLNTRFNDKKSFFIKFFILLFCFSSINGIYPKNYFKKLYNCRKHLYEQRLLQYKLLKTVFSQKNKEIIYIPDKNDELVLNDITLSDFVLNLLLIAENDFDNLKVIVFSKSKGFSELSDDELKELKFSNIVVPKKNKKCLKSFSYEMRNE